MCCMASFVLGASGHVCCVGLPWLLKRPLSGGMLSIGAGALGGGRALTAGAGGLGFAA